MSFSSTYPNGPDYPEFAQRVIDAFQEPMWEPYPHLSANASIDSVKHYIGIVQSSCNTTIERNEHREISIIWWRISPLVYHIEAWSRWLYVCIGDIWYKQERH